MMMMVVWLMMMHIYSSMKGHQQLECISGIHHLQLHLHSQSWTTELDGWITLADAEVAPKGS